ncbi:hypothetical protein RJ639_032355 [Escallonia herrerae]|uniref:Uncharacterized protein n=1 Tax=Escallonia herrerae TaxID=1293975 RepID=A0AA88XAI0_9ASTE|nr:hypothetical protein RJ639_032355 [Escallonia herrerae]
MAATVAKEAWNILQNEFKGSNKIRSYGDTIEDKKIFQKILRNLPMKFDDVMAAIEESKNLNELTLVELMSSLQALEERMHIFEQPIE